MIGAIHEPARRPTDASLRSRSHHALVLSTLSALVLGTLGMALWLFPHDSDAAFLVHDALWSGINAERVPARSINPSHPLFHLLVLALVEPLRALEVPAPGHFACRLISGLAGVWLLLQICSLAGPRRMLVGAAFALVILVSRGFVIEIASGENVISATASALFALTCSIRRPRSLTLTAVALTLALLLRQDNITIVPGVALGIALAATTDRVRSVARLLVWGGLMTLGSYAVIWLATTGGTVDFIAWLLGIGSHGSFSGPEHLEWDRFRVYAVSIEWALTGRIRPPALAMPLVGLSYLAAFVVAGLMLRGSAPMLRLCAPVVLTLMVRAPFHTWFEANNFEWLVLPVVLVAAVSAGLVRGEPATARGWRRAGIASLMGLAGWIAVAHWPYTWVLRERAFIRFVEEATQVDRAEWRFVAVGVRASQALDLLEIPHATLKDGPDSLGDIAKGVRDAPQPTIVMWDRGIIDGMPHSIRNYRDSLIDLDLMEVPAGWEKLSRGRLVYGGRWVPAGASSRPQPR